MNINNIKFHYLYDQSYKQLLQTDHRPTCAPGATVITLYFRLCKMDVFLEHGAEQVICFYNRLVQHVISEWLPVMLFKILCQHPPHPHPTQPKLTYAFLIICTSDLCTMKRRKEVCCSLHLMYFLFVFITHLEHHINTSHLLWIRRTPGVTSDTTGHKVQLDVDIGVIQGRTFQRL